MARSRPLATLAVALAMLVPSAAFADSAGDNQYQDPFGNTQPQQTATNTTPAPAPPAASTQSQASTSQPQAAAQPAAGSTSGALPRTGLDLRFAGGIGVLLVAAGLLVRRRLG
jgi:hypothetical protein